MTRAERDRRAGAMLKARAATLREIAREVKRLGRPNVKATTPEARMMIAAHLAGIVGELFTAAAELLDQPDMPPEASAAEQKLRAAANHSKAIRSGSFLAAKPTWVSNACCHASCRAGN